MFLFLLALFICIPVIEIGLFIQVGQFIGMWPTIFMTLFTAVLGASLVRYQGISTLTSVQSRLNQGELPAQQIMEGFLLAMAGVLLLTPGFLTDTIGFCLLVPQLRTWFAVYVMKKVEMRSISGSSFYQGDVFEGEYQRKEEDPDKKLP